VGDIVDGWQLKSAWYWPQSHNDVVQKLLRQVRKGVHLRYIPGNHDEFLRDYYGTHFGGIEVLEDAVHVAADGKRYLVIHGDLFDVVIRHARWLALLGDKAYDIAIWVNMHFNAVRRVIGLPYWSQSQWAKLKVKNAVKFIGEYERTLAQEARRRGVEGVICGHIHHATIRNDSGLHYNQLRGLGRELHRGRRAFRWTVRNRHMDRPSTRQVYPRAAYGPRGSPKSAIPRAHRRRSAAGIAKVRFFQRKLPLASQLGRVRAVPIAD
jgi:UDP-2,3-diacylglucosamine pyrophosphatase LpxH